ncbi:hypothetical protein MOBT1_000132 [Malassezia obtusa]|uniref:Ste24 endopeptidase n=1 Tax=Malassezia obtusa TaxID=76774 RepID=A0AAF0E1L0_9BASI|nr:hypothetical protein MOBT1_000132 [Malassezia obtusa]
MDKEELAAKLEEGTNVVKAVFSELPSYNVLIPALLEHGVEGLRGRVKLTPGIPLKPMLAKPTKEIGEVLDRFEKVTNFVIDAEAVAWQPLHVAQAERADATEGRLLPFQELSRRKRKDVKAEDIKVFVKLFGFDLLYLNGEPLLHLELSQRRARLFDHFVPVQDEFDFATHRDCHTTEEIQSFLDESVAGGCEGLMVKMLDGSDATYEPSRRSINWLKLKKDYCGYYGKGKRTNVYGAFLLACCTSQAHPDDEDQETYQSICKIGTGFSEADLESHHNTLKELEIAQKKGYYDIGDAKPDVLLTADLSLSPVYSAAKGMIDARGVSLRFPRFLRIRDDKTPEESTSPEQIAQMYRAQAVASKKQRGRDDEDDFCDLKGAAAHLDSPSIPWKQLVIGLLWAVYLFETYVSLRQLRLYDKTTPPKALVPHVSLETFAKSQAYGKDKARFALVSDAVAHIYNLAAVYFDFYALAWAWSGDILTFIGAPTNELTKSAMWVIVNTAMHEVVAVPLSIYRNFVIEEKHGFNKLTAKTYIADTIKEWIMGVVIGAPLIALAVWVIRWAGDYFVVYTVLFFTAIVLFGTVLYPMVIQPFFNKLTPLPEGALRDRIVALASALHFPLKHLYVIDGIIYDTLIEKSTPAEIEAVLAHELGHWAHSDPTKLLLVSQLNLVLMLSLFTLFIHNASLFRAFGFASHASAGAVVVEPYLPVIVGLELFQLVLNPTDAVLKFGINAIVRRMEYAADRLPD